MSGISLLPWQQLKPGYAATSTDCYAFKVLNILDSAHVLIQFENDESYEVDVMKVTGNQPRIRRFADSPAYTPVYQDVKLLSLIFSLEDHLKTICGCKSSASIADTGPDGHRRHQKLSTRMPGSLKP